jgi:hypothetical protein
VEGELELPAELGQVVLPQLNNVLKVRIEKKNSRERHLQGWGKYLEKKRREM